VRKDWRNTPIVALIMAANSESLNVIGLVSGGKDSFFSLLHCLANNHQVIALANLYPPAVSSSADNFEDENSFMYQTAGHALIPLYSEALGLPLYRQEIIGSALNQSKDYHAGSGGTSSSDSGKVMVGDCQDETESLLPLLRKVMAAHPLANAVSTGAILSTYQRTRIESVARRLNLIPLTYLWQFPSLPPQSAGGLLDDLATAGFDVRIVKVASGGLNEELLWGNLMDATVRRRLQRGVDRFGGSVLGEGGEYETLVVDGPRGFWKGRIEVRPEDMWIGKGVGGEAWIRFREGSGVVTRDDDTLAVNEPGLNRNIRRPGLWDNEFKALNFRVPRQIVRYTSENRVWEVEPVLIKNQSSLKLSNVIAPNNETSASEQMLAINSIVMDVLLEHHISNGNSIVFTTMLLRTMADFVSINDAYGRLFTRPNPPARVTVACGNTLPPGVHVMVSLIISLDIASREGLHVQSRSYWAPANIGPYSQAVSVPLQQDMTDVRLVYVAGQIPLVPASMEILRAEDEEGRVAQRTGTELFQRRTCLALQHLWRIGKATSVSWWTDATAFITGTDDISGKAMVAWKTWEAIHQAETWNYTGQEEDDDGLRGLDVWDLRYGGLGSLIPVQSKCHSLPDFRRLSNPTWYNAPNFFAVQVDDLPRGCDIEWQSSGIAYRNDSTPAVQHLFSYISVAWEYTAGETQLQTQIMKLLDERPSAGDFDARIYTPWPELVSKLSMQVIPCRSVWGPNAQRLAAGIVIQNGKFPMVEA